MNILSISSILPIPERIKDNDFVFHTYLNYRSLFKDDQVVIAKPVKINLNIRTGLKGTSRLQKLGKKRTWQIHDFQVEILPYFSMWGLKNLHAIVTRSVFILNRKRIRKLLGENPFHVVHAQFILPDGLLAYLIKKRYNIPYVITTHHESFYFDHFLSRKLSGKILNEASLIVPVNHSNYQIFKLKGFNPIALTPLGFNKDFIRPQKTSTGTKISIITVAELIKLKNVDQVLRAIHRLSGEYELHYTVVGDGPERASLEKLAEELQIAGQVTFRGIIPHSRIADEMYIHDIFIMPSFFETFGRVYFESMAMGIPIICAKNSGIFGIFKDNVEGISVDHTSVDEITSALKFLIVNENARKEMGMKGKQLVENYTWENVAVDLRHKYIATIQPENSSHGNQT